MKKIMIAVAAVLILAGGVVSILKWMKIGPFEETEMADSQPVESKEPSTFLDMEPIVVPILNNNKVQAVIQVQLKLEAQGKDNSIRIQRMMPKISDVFVSELHSFMPRLLKEAERIDVVILKDRLKLIADRNIEKGLIKNVLVQSVLDQPVRK